MRPSYTRIRMGRYQKISTTFQLAPIRFLKDAIGFLQLVCGTGTKRRAPFFKSDPYACGFPTQGAVKAYVEINTL